VINGMILCEKWNNIVSEIAGYSVRNGMILCEKWNEIVYM
jgi:hypothetical protein